VEQQLRRLEQCVGEQIDDRALQSLRGLGARDAAAALAQVDEAVNSQGGTCRNLSSITQSICKRMEKRLKGRKRQDEKPKSDASSAGIGVNGLKLQATSGSTANSNIAGSRARRARRVDEDGDAFDAATDSDDFGDKYGGFEKMTAPENGDRGLLIRTNSHGSEGSAKLHTPASRRSTRSWADIQSGDEEGPADGGGGNSNNLFGSSPAGAAAAATPASGADRAGGGAAGASGEPEDDDEQDEHWTPRRVEKAARRGFELRRRGAPPEATAPAAPGAAAAGNWELKISMAGLEPPLTEAGMERYCRWLRVRLTSFREEHGVEALHRCKGEVDFSHNSMSNQMVWMLLETLAQHEVHTALLKLYANNISQGGVLAICEFIRMNERAESLQELHLSHNHIDDESALELLRTLHFQQPRYPPKRISEGTSEMVLAPVWLRLNHNRVREPDAVRSAAEAEGITICTAWDRTACGTSRCCRQECPLVHLYSFSVQARQNRRDGRERETQASPGGAAVSNAQGASPSANADQQSDSGGEAPQRTPDGREGNGERPHRRRDRRRDRKDRKHRDRDRERDRGDQKAKGEGAEGA